MKDEGTEGEGAHQVMDFSSLEEEHPNSILQAVLNSVKANSLTDDVKYFILEWAEDEDGVTPQELFAELLDWNVHRNVANKIRKMYRAKLKKRKRNQRPEVEEIEDDEDELLDTDQGVVFVDRDKQGRRRKPRRVVRDRRGEGEEVVEVVDSPKQKSKEPVGYVVIDGQSIAAYDNKEFTALKDYEMKKEKHEKEMRKLDEEIKNIAGEQNKSGSNSDDEDKVPITLENGQEVYVDPKTALLFDRSQKAVKDQKTEAERQKDREIAELKRRNQKNEEVIDETKKLLQAIRNGDVNMGTGRTFLDLIDARMKEAKSEPRSVGQQGSAPTEPTSNEPEPPEHKRSEEEKDRIANQVLGNIEKSEEMLNLENEIMNS